MSTMRLSIASSSGLFVGQLFGPLDLDLAGGQRARQQLDLEPRRAAHDGVLQVGQADGLGERRSAVGVGTVDSAVVIAGGKRERQCGGQCRDGSATRVNHEITSTGRGASRLRILECLANVLR
jgi:hypothetical protein